MYSYSNIDEVWSHDPIKEITNKISGNNSNSDFFDRKKQSNFSPSDPKSLSLTSDFNASDSIMNSIKLDSLQCSHNLAHVRKCNKCNKKIKRLVNLKVNERIDDILLERKLNQLRNLSTIKTNDTQKIDNVSNTWKELLVIMVGCILLVFVFLIIFKSLIR